MGARVCSMVGMKKRYIVNLTAAEREALRQLVLLVDIANPNLISDVGVSAVLAEAALRGAKLNVDINLASLRDEALVKTTRDEVSALVVDSSKFLDDVMGKVEVRVRK